MGSASSRTAGVNDLGAVAGQAEERALEQQHHASLWSRLFNGSELRQQQAESIANDVSVQSYYSHMGSDPGMQSAANLELKRLGILPAVSIGDHGATTLSPEHLDRDKMMVSQTENLVNQFTGKNQYKLQE
ncbi:MAG: hypothetical protein ACRD3W_09505, partial [Terriglobales bacterium]